jgi:hypothetical protein
MATKEINARLKEYKTLIESNKATNIKGEYVFENSTITLPYLIKGAYYQIYNPPYISVKEYTYGLYYTELIIEDDNKESKLLKVIDALVSTFEKISTDIVSKLTE